MDAFCKLSFQTKVSKEILNQIFLLFLFSPYDFYLPIFFHEFS